MENIYEILISLIFVILIVTEIRYFQKGWGLNFHLFDLKEQDGWVKPFPSKFERYWLLVVIVSEILLFLGMGIIWILK